MHSIFASIQGESTRAGLPCSFVRLAGCPLRCSYCDTGEVRDAVGKEMEVERLVDQVAAMDWKLVEITGGEPLAQEGCAGLVEAFCNLGFSVLVETSGAFPIDNLDPRARVVMDVKCPGSGMSERVFYGNLEKLDSNRHELKFVVTNRSDFDWAVDLCRKKDLAEKAELLVSPAAGLVEPAELADWVMKAGLPLRVQLQLHKILWPEDRSDR